MNKPHFTVIGANSFVGQALQQVLNTDGHDARFLSRADFDAHDNSASFGSTDVVVYLAQDRNYSQLGRETAGVFEVGALGALRAAVAGIEAGAKAMIYTSTGGVYQSSFDPLSEDCPLSRSDIYSTSKIFGEQILELTEDRLSVSRLRLFGAYGANQTIGLFAGLTNRIKSGQPVTLQNRVLGENDGGFKISLTQVLDIAKAIIETAQLALSNQAPSAMNLAASEAVSIEQIAKTIGQHLAIDPVFETSDSTRQLDMIANTALQSQYLETEFMTIDKGIPFSL